MRECRYELFIDDLPVWGFVGPPPEEAKDEKQIYIYAHKSFDINYNENRVPARATAACQIFHLCHATEACVLHAATGVREVCVQGGQRAPRLCCAEAMQR